jgi:pyruvate dehydrogenase E2 component (dihydrolipoamide acetyltransferase)
MEGGLQPQEAIHIGFAVSLRQGGLVIPAIHHVDAKSLDEVMEALNDVTLRSRTGKLRSSELTDGTVTVTSLGERGVEKVFGVIYPPQVALVGFGRISDKCWADNGMIGVRPVLTATLAADHRATDGRIGARFLQALNNILQNPGQL